MTEKKVEIVVELEGLPAEIIDTLLMCDRRITLITKQFMIKPKPKYYSLYWMERRKWHKSVNTFKTIKAAVEHADILLANYIWIKPVK